MYIAVHVVPWSKVESVAIIGTNIYGHTAYRIKTTQKPQDNAANKDVHKLLAKHLWLSLRDLELVGGHTARDKLFYVHNK